MKQMSLNHLVILLNFSLLWQIVPWKKSLFFICYFEVSDESLIQLNENKRDNGDRSVSPMSNMPSEVTSRSHRSCPRHKSGGLGSSLNKYRKTDLCISSTFI